MKERESRDRISRMTDVKGLRPLRGARSAPLTSAIREENFSTIGAASAAPNIRKHIDPGAAASAAAAHEKRILPPLMGLAFALLATPLLGQAPKPVPTMSGVSQPSNIDLTLTGATGARGRWRSR